MEDLGDVFQFVGQWSKNVVEKVKQSERHSFSAVIAEVDFDKVLIKQVKSHTNDCITLFDK